MSQNHYVSCFKLNVSHCLQLRKVQTKEEKTEGNHTKLELTRSDATEQQKYDLLSLNCKISAIWLVETACIFLIFLIATVQISVECETQESEAGYTKNLNLHIPKTYTCRYRINQHLIVLKLDSVSVNESTAPNLLLWKFRRI